MAGTLGFYLLGDSRGVLESVYLTVMIVTTVGLKDQYPHFNDAESAWSLVIMLGGGSDSTLCNREPGCVFDRR